MEANRVGEEYIRGIITVGQWAVDVDGDPVALLSLPVGAVARIQERTGFRWNRVMVDPLERIDVAEMLVLAAYEVRGKPAPNLGDSVSIVSRFVEVPADAPPPVGGSSGVDPTTAS